MLFNLVDYTKWILVTVYPNTTRRSELSWTSSERVCGLQGPVVRKLDNTIHWINLYPVDNTVGFPRTRSDLHVYLELPDVLTSSLAPEAWKSRSFNLTTDIKPKMWENCSIIDFIGFGAHGLHQRGILKKIKQETITSTSKNKLKYKLPC